MWKRWKKLKTQIMGELKFYQVLAQDHRVPKLSKWLLGLAIAYAISPIDLIPDFIPVLGHLDDLVILPLLVFLALRLIPTAVINDCRNKMTDRKCGRHIR